MAKGFKHGAGGASALNFNVVGGTSQPVNPKENTIWVNTQTEISGWVFSAEEPGEPAEGMVWISTGLSSTVEFNALKKNGIQVYPISAKQYISGAWVDKTAKIYQGGAWKELITYLYNKGNECTDLTGGWVSVASLGFAGSGIGTKAPTITQNTGYTIVKQTEDKSGYYRTTNRINLDSAKNIVLVGYLKETTSHPVWTQMSCHANVPTYWGQNQAAYITASIGNGVLGTYRLDVSGLTGDYYICLGCHGSSASIRIDQIYLEE